VTPIPLSLSIFSMPSQDYDDHAFFDSAIQLEIEEEVDLHQLAIDYRTAEFICYTTYKLWYSIPKDNEIEKEEYLRSFPGVTEPDWLLVGNHYEYFPPPMYCERWYNAYVTQVYHLLKAAELDVPLIVVALFYLSRIRMRAIDPRVSPPVLLYQLLVGALMISQKVHSDIRYSMSTWSKISRLDFVDTLRSETHFFLLLHYDMHIPAVQYEQWINMLQHLQKEHRMVIKSVGMTDKEFEMFSARHMRARPDLIQEAEAIRKREGS
jgi:hypothetical protein